LLSQKNLSGRLALGRTRLDRTGSIGNDGMDDIMKMETSQELYTACTKLTWHIRYSLLYNTSYITISSQSRLPHNQNHSLLALVLHAFHFGTGTTSEDFQLSRTVKPFPRAIARVASLIHPSSIYKSCPTWPPSTLNQGC
jgi:hypothetical protein